ncbi:hypothetical protein [Pseudomonas sp. CGJS7]|uniref:hypothetical protein n=1 Tax=Pseudomonas sp. CGJS7 TaxID=3109348 RepID=UPI00300BBF7E
MELAELLQKINADIDARCTAMRWTHDEWLILTVEFEEPDPARLIEGLEDLRFAHDYRQRRFELHCRWPVEAHCRIGEIGSIACEREHPLLLDHVGSQSQLFFSSVPESAAEVYFTAHKAIASVLKHWRDPATVLCHPPERLESALAAGNGALARGPDAVIQALERALSGLLRVNAVPVQTFGERTPKLALTWYQHWIVCDSVDVVEPTD